MLNCYEIRSTAVFALCLLFAAGCSSEQEGEGPAGSGGSAAPGAKATGGQSAGLSGSVADQGRGGSSRSTPSTTDGTGGTEPAATDSSGGSTAEDPTTEASGGESAGGSGSGGRTGKGGSTALSQGGATAGASAKGGSSGSGKGGSTALLQGGSSTGPGLGVGGSAAGGSAGSPGTRAVGGAATGGAAAGSSSTGRNRGGRSSAAPATSGGSSAVVGLGGSSGGTATGGAASGGAAAGGSTASGSCEKFSFFIASMKRMIELSGNAQGFGGDLRYGQADGLAGADKICTDIAKAALPCAGEKTWRAFLSTSNVDAVTRVGEGPWHDRNGEQVWADVAQLTAASRPPTTYTNYNDLPNEDGVPNHDYDLDGTTTDDDNHDVLTGSGTNGKKTGTAQSRCNDWTSSVGSTGKPQIGHAWPRGGGGGGDASHWIAAHTAPGCAPAINMGNSNSCSNGVQGVGCSGGYGAIYCFATTP